MYDLATKLMDEGVDTSDGARMLREIERNSAPGISGDIRELQRLAKLKRKPGDYRSRVIHHLSHMQHCTWAMHFLPAV